MALYHYKVLTAHGEFVDGQMEALSISELATRLQEQGHHPVEMRLATEVSGAPSLHSFVRSRPFSGPRLVQFTQQLATLLTAGQALDRALAILLDLPEDARSRRVINEIREAVREGMPLSTALEGQHGVFSRLYVNMVRAGESGGNLPETLQRLADYLERSEALKGKVINALIYPAILVVVVTLSLFFLLGYVVPQFAVMYESLDVELPWFTRAIIVLGSFIRGQWWLILGSLIAFLIWLNHCRQNPQIRARLDAWLLKQKIVGLLLAKLETARLTRTLGTLLRNGVPLLAALGIARKVVGNAALSSAIGEASEEVKNGHGLASALDRQAVFPKLAVQMIQVGEESGQLDAMLMKTAEVFELESTQVLDRLLTALVPAVTLLLAAIVGIVIVAVLVPLYDLTSAMN